LRNCGCRPIRFQKLAGSNTCVENQNGTAIASASILLEPQAKRVELDSVKQTY